MRFNLTIFLNWSCGMSISCSSKPKKSHNLRSENLDGNDDPEMYFINCCLLIGNLRQISEMELVVTANELKICNEVGDREVVDRLHLVAPPKASNRDRWWFVSPLLARETCPYSQACNAGPQSALSRAVGMELADAREHEGEIHMNRRIVLALALATTAFASLPAMAQRSGGTLVQITQPEPPNRAPTSRRRPRSARSLPRFRWATGVRVRSQAEALSR